MKINFYYTKMISTTIFLYMYKYIFKLDTT